MISSDELAARVGVSPERIERLAEVGALVPDGDGRYDPADVHRVRLLNAFEEAGVPLDALLAATRAGRISLRYYGELHPAPRPVSNRTYAEFAASIESGREHLTRLFGAFGLAEPEPDARLTTDDEVLITELLDVVVATGAPDLGLRAVRLFGENARRSADGALGVYADAVGRTGEDVSGLPIDDQFERLLRPWARFARQAPALGGWLATKHLSRAIDEYSVMSTEQILEDEGLLAERAGRPPAVAFVDLTGFTRMTEEMGDEAAAAVALRLGEIAADVVERFRGRVVKLLGDGVLIRFGDAGSAIDASLALLAALPAAGLPNGHAGVASGSLIARDGDVFGRTVNLAARIADAAPDGHLYTTTESLTSVDPSADGHRAFETRPVRGVVLHGIGSIDLVDIIGRRA